MQLQLNKNKTKPVYLIIYLIIHIRFTYIIEKLLRGQNILKNLFSILSNILKNYSITQYITKYLYTNKTNANYVSMFSC